MSERNCKSGVHTDFTGRPCSRKAVRDGYCTQHHPDSVKKRAEESDERYRKKWENSPFAKLQARVKKLEKALNKTDDAADSECADPAANLDMIRAIAREAMKG